MPPGRPEMKKAPAWGDIGEMWGRDRGDEEGARLARYGRDVGEI